MPNSPTTFQHCSTVFNKSLVARAMAEAKLDDSPFTVEYPQGVPYSAWNFNIYTMLTIVKKTCFGQVKTNLNEVMKQLLPGTTQTLLEKSKSLELDNCFIANQKYDAERVGSMPEDVPIIQPIRQPVDAEGEDIMRDAGLSFECDYNLCFKDISASEKTQQNPDLNPPLRPLQLQIIPSLSPGRVELVVPPSVECVPGLENLCVEDRGCKLLSSELLIEQMYNVLTIITAILNVNRIQHHHKTDNLFKDEDNLSLANYLQYVGQAGPAVHVVMCISDLGKKGHHLFLTEDVSMSVPCQEWPSCAKDWPSRERPSGWPPRKLIDKVTQDGCHVVPKFDESEKNPEKSQSDSKPSSSSEMAKHCNSSGLSPKTQWRYSFSFAEKTLMTSITKEQKICYIIFKYLFARYVKLNSVITTYTAKTIFLWALETVPADQWTVELVGDRVKGLVEELRACVKKKYCQHYFISGSNTLQQMDDKSRNITLENGFSLLDEHMAEAPVLGSETFEAPRGFPVDFMFTYKTFYTINAWLESLNAQMMAKLDPPSKLPTEKNLTDLLDNSKTYPILMSEILKYLVLSEEIYGQPLPVPPSLLQHQKVAQLVKFLEKSIRSKEKFEESMEELEVELRFLHLQFKIIDEIEKFFNDNPNFAYSFVNSSDESEAEGDD